MEIQDPEWHLAQRCPFCDSASALLLVACPGCGHVGVRCDEDGSFYAEPLAVLASAMEPHTGVCPRCATVRTDAFRVAKDSEITAAGLGPGDYE